MPNMNKSHITMILDRSGSMGSVASDVIGAVNLFIDEQKKVPSDCTWTLVQFDDQAPFEIVANHVRLVDAKHLTSETYQPRGGTPLLDAIGKGIVTLGEKLASLPENERPGKVIFVIQTDGQENQSKEYTKARIKEMIERQTKDYNWTFIFLGANQDAIHEASQFGIAAANAMSNSHSAQGYSSTMRATGQNVARFRMSADPNEKMAAYSAEQRDEAMKP